MYFYTMIHKLFKKRNTKIVHLAIARNLWKNFHYTLVNYLPHSVKLGPKLLCKTMPTKDQGHNLGLHSVFYVPKISLKLVKCAVR